jgi:hypothetical protein
MKRAVMLQNVGVVVQRRVKALEFQQVQKLLKNQQPKELVQVPVIPEKLLLLHKNLYKNLLKLPKLPPHLLMMLQKLLHLQLLQQPQKVEAVLLLLPNLLQLPLLHLVLLQKDVVAQRNKSKTYATTTDLITSF